MTHEDARAELAELERAHGAHGELAAMRRQLNTCEELMMHDRDAEAKAMVRAVWSRCQEMRATFLARPYNEHVAGVLAGINPAEELALTWLNILRTKPPGWAEWRQQFQGSKPESVP